MQDKKRIYEEIPSYSKEIALQEVGSEDSTRVVKALLSLACNNDDWRSVQNLCLEHAKNADESIRGIALLCFGHLARIHKKMDVELVIPVLMDALNDKSYFIRNHAETALDDIEMFCKMDTKELRTEHNS